MRSDIYTITVKLPEAGVGGYWTREARRIVKERTIILDEPRVITQRLVGRARHFQVAADERRVLEAKLELEKVLDEKVIVAPRQRGVKIPWVRYREKHWRFAVDRFPNGAVDVQVGPWVWTNEWDAYRQRLEDEGDVGA